RACQGTKMAAGFSLLTTLLLVALASWPELCQSKPTNSRGRTSSTNSGQCDKKLLPKRSVVCYVRPDDPHFDLSKLNPCLCTHVVYGTLQIKGDLSLGPFRYGNMTALELLAPSQPAARAHGRASGLGPRGAGAHRGAAGAPGAAGVPQGGPHRTSCSCTTSAKRRPSSTPVVTVTVAKEPHLVNHAYDFRTVVKNADYVNVPAFMFHDGQPEYASHPAPLHGDRGAMDNTDSLVNLVLAMGVPRQKVVVGVPMFGMTYRLADPNIAAIGAPLYHGHDDSYQFNHPQGSRIQSSALLQDRELVFDDDCILALLY
ncbi:hypothetical protein MTO96_045005, partial [Rhipicephalus appendiculatus]